MGKHVGSGDGTVVHLNQPRDACRQPGFVLDGGCLKSARRAILALNQEAADLPRLGQLRPDQQHVRDRRIRDPRLGAAEEVVPALRGVCARRRLHRTRVTSVIGFRQTEGAEKPAPCHRPQKILLLLRRPELVDATHDQGRLNRHAGTVAAIHTLDCPRYQTSRHGGYTSAAIPLEVGAQKTQLAHLGKNVSIEVLVAVGLYVGERVESAECRPSSYNGLDGRA